MINGKVSKTPAAELDYGVDWLANGWLEAGETIAASTWLVDPGLTRGESFSPTPHPATSTATTTTVWLGGGVLGYKYPVANTITTSAGRVDTRTFEVYITTRSD